MGSFSLRWAFGKGGGGSRRSDGEKTKHKNRGESRDDEKEFGVTEQLLDFVKGFTVDTFKNFPLQDVREAQHTEDPASSPSNLRKDLTEWQERHATLVLSKAKEIAQLRYNLCPRYLKEEQFWRIYFLLVKGYVAPYEIRAVQKARIKRMELEDDKSVDKADNEVEMMEQKQSTSLSCKMQYES